MHYVFARLDEKHTLLETLRKFSKVFKRFLKTIAKVYYFRIFSKTLTDKSVWKAVENFRKFSKNVS